MHSHVARFVRYRQAVTTGVSQSECMPCEEAQISIMTTLPAVLVIGSPNHEALSEDLFEAGLTPVVRQTVLAAIEALRRDSFMAAVIDCESAEVDVLEVILNIRDLDERLRIFVLSEHGVDLGGLRAREYVSVVDRAKLIHKLTPTLISVDEDKGEEGASSKDGKATSTGATP